MQVKVTILSDNAAGPGLFVAEHGWSALLEVDGHQVMLDAGQGKATIPNADALGLDLRAVEAIVLSHGHFDHTAGLPALISRTGPKPLFLHPDALEPKYRKFGPVEIFIGMPHARAALEAWGAPLRLEPGPCEVVPGVWTTGEVKRRFGAAQGDADLVVRRDGEVIPDPLTDDQSLVVRGDDSMVILLGCCHAGLANTLTAARELTGLQRIKAVIGGSHLGFLSDEQAGKELEQLGKMEPELLVLGHCTGPVAASRLYHERGEGFRFCHTGLSLQFEL
ncbi:MAG: MBL fold metallo-hydrolase [Candidatus Geothermincolia bacterium]